MKISYNWLKDFIQIDETPEKIGSILTQTGLEVESIDEVEKIKGGLEGLVVGEVLTCEQHPNADKLKLTRVDVGNGEPLPIVCGAPNVATGQKVIVATVNTMIYPSSGEPFKIKKSKIRGEVSEGMLCAEDEIGMGASHDGLLVLNTDKPNGTSIKELFDTGKDFVFEIGLTPNRGDATGHLGAARDLRAYFNRPLIETDFKTPEKKIDRPIEVSVENTEACPRYSGATIRGVKVGPSPDWLQWRLRAVGLSPINNIVDITNYVMMSLGQPMHAFDADVTGEKITVGTLSSGTKFKTLDEVERTLHEKDLMICNDKGGMCIAGVFGGVDSGVKDSTTDIFLESAYFSADWVRATAMRHSLSTDASFRFERGTDPEITIQALDMATTLILEYAGGYLASDYTDIYPSRVEKVKIPTTFHNFHRLIGEEIPNGRILEILNGLDIETVEMTEEGFTAVVPAYRSEVTREADLVEEVLRIYGFNNIPLEETLSAGYMAHFNEKEPYKLQENVSQYLAGSGYSEIQTNSLTNPEYFHKIPVGENPVEILNKSSEELGYMKTTPIYTGLESLRHNINRRQKNLRFFEFSKTYQKADTYKETELLSFYLTGESNEASWNKSANPITFYDLMQTVLSVFSSLKMDEPTFEELIDENYSYGLTVTYNNAVIGKIGKLHNKLTGYFDIDQEVFYAELLWKKLIKGAKTQYEFSPLSKYPEVRRDLSLVIDEGVSYKEIKQLAFKFEKKLLNRLNVFSVYKGDKLDAGKKSYAISFYLQDKEQTLSDKVIDKTMNNLIRAFETNIGALIRK
ncbi:phenylalanine--tRNA ligase subunit beta [Marinoscillum sp. MHG1-6]|uniref:phenylalanine--tRNA ligase subunit beta n=1 Tax=Marinoscillum sp. MHG1-6 TaxID=2959627 RepID=UPI002157564A|nr:phenylalanine--tRNA ligase subunit beta [Marinoscillum sp. MHG1-6]